jgi:hypothetical protein
MIAYAVDEDIARLLTIHPLKEGQKDNRESKAADGGEKSMESSIYFMTKRKISFTLLRKGRKKEVVELSPESMWNWIAQPAYRSKSLSLLLI